MKTDNTRVSPLHNFGSGLNTVPATSFKSNVKIGVQPTAVARRKTQMALSGVHLPGDPGKTTALATTVATLWHLDCEVPVLSGGALSTSSTRSGRVCIAKCSCRADSQCLRSPSRDRPADRACGWPVFMRLAVGRGPRHALSGDITLRCETTRGAAARPERRGGILHLSPEPGQGCSLSLKV